MEELLDLLKIVFGEINTKDSIYFSHLQDEEITQNFINDFLINHKKLFNDTIYILIFSNALANPNYINRDLVEFIDAYYQPENYEDIIIKCFLNSYLLLTDDIIIYDKDNYYNNDIYTVNNLRYIVKTLLLRVKNYHNFKNILKETDSTGSTFLFYIKHFPIEIIEYILKFISINYPELFNIVNNQNNSVMLDIIFTKFNYNKLCLYANIIDKKI